MALETIDPSSTLLRHLAMVQVKFSGVHIGGGIYLTANHNPEPGGTGQAWPQRGLDGQAARHSTTEHDFTIPDGTADWSVYDDASGYVQPGYDMSMHVDNRLSGTWYDGPAAPMLVMSDASDLIGADAYIAGYPRTPPNGAGNWTTPYETTGTVTYNPLNNDYDVNGDEGRSWDISGAEVLDGMSGSGTWASYTTPDGTSGEYLIGTVARNYTTGLGATGAYSADIGAQYHDLAAAIEALTGDAARSADDFARNVLMAGQSLGSSSTTVEGTFFHEDIWGGVNNDLLMGAGGNDSIWGGDGDDTLDGGEGDDTLTGGSGRDYFRGLGSGSDLITDFNDTEDVVDLSAYFANLGALRAASTDNGDGSITIDLSDPALRAPGGAQLIVYGLGIDDLDTSTTMVACFTEGTLIDTPDGPRPIEELQEGAQVTTRDHGAQPVRWHGRRQFSALDLAMRPALRPIRIRAGALGANTPVRDLIVSPQHRILVRSGIAQRMFGTAEVLVAARQLLEIEGIDTVADGPDTGEPGVTYHHILLPRHEVVFANGAEAESLYAGTQALASMSEAQRAEILAIFPELAAGDMPGARTLSPGRKGRQLALRHRRNARPLVTGPA